VQPSSKGPVNRESDDDDRFGLGLELLRALADQEISRADTARARSRQAFALAAGFFAVVQTVVYGAFVSRLVTEGHRTSTLINHTKWAAIALAVCAVGLLIAELPLGSRNLTPDIVLGTVREPPGDKSARQEFAELYALIVEMHRHANRIRFRLVVATQIFALASIALVIWELLTALHASL
jgi:hypothetical protein